MAAPSLPAISMNFPTLELPPTVRDASQDPDYESMTGCRRFVLDRSLLRLSLSELEFFKAETDIESEQALLDHIHQVASDAYQVRPIFCVILCTIHVTTFTLASPLSLHPVVHVYSVSTSA